MRYRDWGHSEVDAGIDLQAGSVRTVPAGFDSCIMGNDWRSSKTTMLRFGTQIRLTRPEAEAFLEITDFPAHGVRTLAELRDYVARCKRYYCGTSHATQFLHWLIDEQVHRCLDDQ